MSAKRPKPTPDQRIQDWIDDTRLIVDSGAKDATDAFLFGRGLTPAARRAYFYVLKRFATWVEANEIAHLKRVKPRNIGAHIEGLLPHTAKTLITNPGKTRLQALAVIRAYYDALIFAEVLATNPARSYHPRGLTTQSTPTPALTPQEFARMLAAIPTTTPLGLRNRALLGLLAGTSCRIGAALKLKRRDIQDVGGIWRVTLNEKGGKTHTLPLSDAVWGFMSPFLAMLPDDPDTLLFPAWDQWRKRLTTQPMPYVEAYRAIRAIALSAGIEGKHITPHSLRATAITALLDAGFAIETAQHIAGHANPTTTRGYDRRDRTVKPDDMEKLSQALALSEPT